jgi:hypothetical protein
MNIIQMRRTLYSEIMNTMPEIHFTGGGRSGHWEIKE